MGLHRNAEFPGELLDHRTVQIFRTRDDHNLFSRESSGQEADFYGAEHAADLGLPRGEAPCARLGWSSAQPEKRVGGSISHGFAGIVVDFDLPAARAEQISGRLIVGKKGNVALIGEIDRAARPRVSIDELLLHARKTRVSIDHDTFRTPSGSLH